VLVLTPLSVFRSPDVSNVEQAKIAEAAGACAVMALERVPSEIRRDGGVARMSHPAMIRAIQAAVSIPVSIRELLVQRCNKFLVTDVYPLPLLA
jgi:pyridoxal biosynthesis lyase PdxS